MPLRTLPLLWLLGVLGSVAAWAQAEPSTLTGTVVDDATGRPLPGAHVFIAASMMGTATDDAGRFRLDGVPPGAHRLYVSMVGYQPAARDTLLRPDRTYTFDLRLTPTVVQMEEVTVSARENRRWRRRLRKFERWFLGETDYAGETDILNPEVLDFDGGWARLEATASAPLVIENRALGYRVQYFLKEFERVGNVVRYDGEPLFEELTPEDPDEAATWTANRETAFYGSFRHFMLALLNGTTKEQGFTTYRRLSLEHLTTTGDRFRFNPEDLLDDGPSPTEKMLNFPGYVEVIYASEREDPAYLRWRGRSAWSRPGAQHSWMRLTSGPTVVDHTGEVLDPYGVTVYGYFAFERVADQLPKEYRPAKLREKP